MGSPLIGTLMIVFTSSGDLWPIAMVRDSWRCPVCQRRSIRMPFEFPANGNCQLHFPVAKYLRKRVKLSAVVEQCSAPLPLEVGHVSRADRPGPRSILYSRFEQPLRGARLRTQEAEWTCPLRLPSDWIIEGEVNSLADEHGLGVRPISAAA